MMRKVLQRVVPLSAACALVLAMSTRANAATIGVDIFTDNTYSTLVGPTIVTSDIDFTNWQPYGLDSFSALIWGVFDVSANGYYQIDTSASDEAALYIDGNLVLDGSGHQQGYASLAQAPQFGTPSFDLLFDATGSHTPANLTMTLPCSGDYCVSYGDAPIPEPISLLLLGPPAVGMLLRRRWQAA
jgi:hypothetical protein